MLKRLSRKAISRLAAANRYRLTRGSSRARPCRSAHPSNGSGRPSRRKFLNNCPARRGSSTEYAKHCGHRLMSGSTRRSPCGLPIAQAYQRHSLAKFYDSQTDFTLHAFVVFAAPALFGWLLLRIVALAARKLKISLA